MHTSVLSCKQLTYLRRLFAGQDTSIRRAVLGGSLALVLAAVLLSAVLGFAAFRQALQVEIARNLDLAATAQLARIDAFLFERLEDMREWRRLELLQDLRVGDLDKRLARLLADLRAGHGGVYAALLATNAEDRVVAASDPRLVGRRRPPGPARLKDPHADEAPIIIEAYAGAPDQGPLVLRTAIDDAFGDGRLGTLYALLDWDQLRALLTIGLPEHRRTALLLDADGTPLAMAGPPPSPPLLARIRAGESLAHDDEVLIGAARSNGHQHYAGLGWRLLLLEPSALAYAPIWRLGWAVAGGLVLSLLLAGWLSLRLSRRIADPLIELTAYTRQLPDPAAGRPPPIEGGVAEVGELARAFDDMVEALARSREQLLRAGKLAAVGEMAAIMAHEVRTPLGILKSSAQLLGRRPDLAPQERELVGYIEEETGRLNRLVTTLLECAAPRPPRFRPQDLHAIAEQVIGLIGAKAEKHGVALELVPQASNATVNGDREQLIQVLLNLLLNAIALLPPGGRLRLGTADSALGLQLTVDDNGPGIAAEDRERVFDPFYTRREGGIGLGLTIVAQIVQAHDGTITAEDSPLGGARFRLQLPLIRDTETT